MHKVDLIEEIPARSIGFCFLKGVPLSSAAQKLVEFVSSEATLKNQP
ncbi:MAG: hypothetical protein GX796_07645 [Clostridiaceae bacterium]|nr:hypothetical protein [Clostridiaceae bacterium]